MNGIITLPLVPLRESDNEKSELCTQLLFGELVEIIETRDRWLLVHNLSDNYRGWVDRKMIHILTSQEKERIVTEPTHIVQIPFIQCEKADSNEKMLLPGGSIIHAEKTEKFTLGAETYSLDPSGLKQPVKLIGEELIRHARQYLNTPYLWGGKSVFGIDCSGLVQVVYSMCGVSLQRDASEQAESGTVINTLSESKAGDLAFFENTDGKIIHVGILVNPNQIIHASGWVKVETIDSIGIISARTGEYTHKLNVVKRLIQY